MTTHFSGEALQFLRELEGHNDRGWFEDHKPVYLSEVREPMLDLVDRVNESLAGFAPGTCGRRRRRSCASTATCGSRRTSPRTRRTSPHPGRWGVRRRPVRVTSSACPAMRS
ncbi:DUF2461 family protein [Cryobacterium breve]|uniref:DUF2461 family protein n=1 Tax=Cryobacterium breve TaxID=1259258 RepID=A0ABY7N8Z0_9MICO|nr:DUF2461 family protein [Cryobacterium breve]